MPGLRGDDGGSAGCQRTAGGRVGQAISRRHGDTATVLAFEIAVILVGAETLCGLVIALVERRMKHGDD